MPQENTPNLRRREIIGLRQKLRLGGTIELPSEDQLGGTTELPPEDQQPKVEDYPVQQNVTDENDVDYRDLAEIDQRERLAEVFLRHFPQKKEEYGQKIKGVVEADTKTEPEIKTDVASKDVVANAGPVNEVGVEAASPKLEEPAPKPSVIPEVDIDFLLNLANEASTEIPGEPATLVQSSEPLQALETPLSQVALSPVEQAAFSNTPPVIEVSNKSSEEAKNPEVLESLEVKAERLAKEVKLLTIGVSERKNKTKKATFTFIPSARNEAGGFTNYKNANESPLTKLNLKSATDLYNLPQNDKTAELFNPPPGEVTIRFEPLNRNTERLAWLSTDKNKEQFALVVSMVTQPDAAKPMAKEGALTTADFFFFDLSAASTKEFIEASLANPAFVKIFLTKLSGRPTLIDKYADPKEVFCASSEGWKVDKNEVFSAYPDQKSMAPAQNHPVIRYAVVSDGEHAKSWKQVEPCPPNSTLEEFGITL